jgi:hypothetical protein
LGERCRRNQKCPGDFFGGESTDLAQGERDLSLGRQRGMAAGEDQAESIILDFLVVIVVIEGRFVAVLRLDPGGKILLRSVEARADASGRWP